MAPGLFCVDNIDTNCIGLVDTFKGLCHDIHMTDGDSRPRLILCERYLKITEVASLLGIDRTTVYKLIDEREISSVAFGPRGGAIRVPEPSLIAYLERRGIAFAFTADDHADDLATAGAA